MNKTYSKKDDFEKINILGVWFSNVNYQQVLEYLLKIVKNDSRGHFLVTPNPEILMLADRSSEYEEALNSADLALADGVGITWAAKVVGKSFIARIAGVDLVENLCRDVAKRPITVGFLGGGRGVAEKTADCLSKKYPRLQISLIYEGGPDNKTLDFIKKETEKLNGKKIDILFVAFGSPKQELWIYSNLKDLSAKLTIGVGGAFDFISGNVKRAPIWIRKIGLEWLFRLIVQPWRIKRQLSLIKFIVLVLKKKFAGSV